MCVSECVCVCVCVKERERERGRERVYSHIYIQTHMHTDTFMAADKARVPHRAQAAIKAARSLRCECAKDSVCCGVGVRACGPDMRSSAPGTDSADGVFGAKGRQ